MPYLPPLLPRSWLSLCTAPRIGSIGLTHALGGSSAMSLVALSFVCAACFRFVACLQLDGCNMAVAGSHAIAQRSVNNKTSLLTHAASDAPRSSRFMPPSRLAAPALRHRLVWRALRCRLIATVVALNVHGAYRTASSIGSYLRLRRIAVGLRAALDSDASAHCLWLAHSGGLFVALNLPSALPNWWSSASSMNLQHGWFDHRAKTTADHDHTHTCGTSCPWRRTSVPHRAGRPAGVR